MLRVVRRVASKGLWAFEQRVALDSSRLPAAKGWIEAPASLRGIVDTQPPICRPHHGAVGFEWRKTPQDGLCGLLNLDGGLLLSEPCGRALAGLDPNAREVLAATRRGRPVYINPRRHVLPRLIRGGVRDLASSKDAVRGKSILLGTYWPDANNYFHFWLDSICDLWFAEQMGVRRGDIRNYLLPFAGLAWQYEILEICGIPSERVMPLSSFSRRSFSDLVIPVRAKGGRTNPTWMVRAAQEISACVPRRNGGDSLNKIYVSRQDASLRSLVGENEIISLLKARGYRVVTCSGLTVRQQQRLFMEADVIISPHGAALTNLVWCRPGTRVIEILPVEHGNPCFMDIATIGQLEYSYVESRLVDPHHAPQTGAVSIVVDDLLNLAP